MKPLRLVGLFFLLGPLVLLASASPTRDDGEDCELWGYDEEPFEFLGDLPTTHVHDDQFEFLGESTTKTPHYGSDFEFLGESTTNAENSINYRSDAPDLEEFHGPSYAEPTPADRKVYRPYADLDEFHGPQFAKPEATTNGSSYESSLDALGLEEFHGPAFAESSPAPVNHESSLGVPALEEFHGPSFAEPASVESYQRSMNVPELEEFHGPAFAEPSTVDSYQRSEPELEEFHGPAFAEPSPASVDSYQPSLDELGLEEYHGPSFAEPSPAPVDNYQPSLDSLGLVESHSPSSAEPSPASVDSYQPSSDAPSLEEYQDQQVAEPSPAPVDDYQPASDPYGLEDMPFLEPSPPRADSRLYNKRPSVEKPQVAVPLKGAKVYDEFLVDEEQYVPKRANYGKPRSRNYAPYRKTSASEVHDEFILDERDFERKPVHAGRPYKKRPIAKKPRFHDSFDHDSRKVAVERADIPPKSAKVYDELLVDEEQFVPKRAEKPRSHKYAPKTEYRKTNAPRDEFIVEERNFERKPVHAERLHKKRPVAKKPRVHDSFAQVSHKTIVDRADVPPKNAEVDDEFASGWQQLEQRKAKKERVVYARPAHKSTHVSKQEPVVDSFGLGVSHDVIVEPVRKSLKPTASVNDEFAVEDEPEQKVYRVKRSVQWSPSGTRKLVCLRRRSKTPIVAKLLLASDFTRQATADQISRCVGRRQGDAVASGLCKKHFLRCAPTINVLMCTGLDEVFSRQHGSCVSRKNLTECSRNDRNAIASSTDAFDGDFNEFCFGRPDGFYRDASNCSRVLQCFDGELFEYPPCRAPLAFDEKRGVCDFASTVEGCGGGDTASNATELARVEEGGNNSSTPVTTSGASNAQCLGRNHGDFMVDSADCTQYSRCVWGNVVPMRCPNGTAFNPAISVCDYANQVSC